MPPFFVDIDLLSPSPKQCTWKMNDSLLQNPEVLEELTRELRSFFSSNAIEDRAPMMVWEVHKSYLRGVMIKTVSRIRKARTKQIVEILEKIRAL